MGNREGIQEDVIKSLEEYVKDAKDGNLLAYMLVAVGKETDSGLSIYRHMIARGSADRIVFCGAARVLLKEIENGIIEEDEFKSNLFGGLEKLLSKR